jgi:hypothetical protein
MPTAAPATHNEKGLMQANGAALDAGVSVGIQGRVIVLKHPFAVRVDVPRPFRKHADVR